jgi:tRNA-modifying protein YgfZ
MRCESRNASAIVARTDWLGIPGYDILIETPCAAGLREALAQAGVPAVPDDVAQAVRVESGRPLFGVDMDEHTIPLEAGIEDRAISFSKGCYVGQEVIIRVLHRGGGRIARRLVGLTLGDGSGAQPARGQALTADGRDVGRLTSVVHSPALDRDIALGYVARELSEPGTALQLASGVSALVTELPFI